MPRKTTAPTARVVRVRAFAKINLSLRVLGRRTDGYHDVRTIYQSIALHDTLVFTQRRGPLEIACDDADCPADETNLVYRAAEAAWRATGRRGRPSGFDVAIEKRIPIGAGLGGGSSDAAAMLRAVPLLWGRALPLARAQEVAATLGADVPFFLVGGTALGVARGDVLFPLPDWPQAWVVLVAPGFAVSTERAYEWWDRLTDAPASIAASGRRAGQPSAAIVAGDWGAHLGAGELRNDLEPAVLAHHAEIGRLIAEVRHRGATWSAMSGSGSAVFGLFASLARATSAATTLAGPGGRALITRTVGRTEYARRASVQ